MAVAVPMFSRVDRLEKLLNSVENTEIKKCYIADNGEMTENKEELYSRSYSFELVVYDLEYDSGVGNCRSILSERPSEEFLLFLDPDMTVPHNYELLIQQLRSRADLGGVSGLIKEHGRIYTSASDLMIENNKIYRHIRESKEIKHIQGGSFVEFDFVPQVGVFRRACFEDYTWDKFYRTQREHIDFFLGHKQNTSWKFAMCPQVLFPHYPGGSNSYKNHRQSQEKRSESHKYFCEKWGFEDLVVECKPWIDTYPHYVNQKPNKIKQFKEKYREDGLLTALIATVRYFSNRN